MKFVEPVSGCRPTHLGQHLLQDQDSRRCMLIRAAGTHSVYGRNDMSLCLFVSRCVEMFSRF